MPTLLQKIDQERSLERVTEAIDAAKMCRVTLSKDATRPIPLTWCQGRGFQTSLILLKPGQSVDQPLEKCHAWFGPFDLYKKYEECRDERELEKLREKISAEATRYLKRYDYPKDLGNKKTGFDDNPSGPHRSPDVTITVMNSDGTTEEPVELHRIYGIGKYDEEYPLDSFRPTETAAEMKARFDAQLRERDTQVEAMRRELAQVAGIVKGAILGKSDVAASQESVAS